MKLCLEDRIVFDKGIEKNLSGIILEIENDGIWVTLNHVSSIFLKSVDIECGKVEIKSING